MKSHEVLESIDPDPFTIASTFFGAAALVLQFIQVRQASPGNPPSAANKISTLEELDSQVEHTSATGNKLLRTIDRGAKNADQDFYDTPYRVGSMICLDAEYHGQMQGHLADMYAALANTSRWINHIIGSNPVTAASIGRRLGKTLVGTDLQLNRIMQEGLSNRQAVEEGKAALRALHDAIQAELDSRN